MCAAVCVCRVCWVILYATHTLWATDTNLPQNITGCWMHKHIFAKLKAVFTFWVNINTIVVCIGSVSVISTYDVRLGGLDAAIHHQQALKPGDGSHISCNGGCAVHMPHSPHFFMLHSMKGGSWQLHSIWKQKAFEVYRAFTACHSFFILFVLKAPHTHNFVFARGYFYFHFTHTHTSSSIFKIFFHLGF